MAEQNLDIRTTVYQWVRGRRGYMAGAVVALVLVVFAVARFAPPADVALADAPAARAPAAVANGGADAVEDSAAAAEEIAATAAPAIVLEGASTREMFGFATIEDGVPRVARPGGV
jgi:hypothetical protein